MQKENERNWFREIYVRFWLVIGLWLLLFGPTFGDIINLNTQFVGLALVVWGVGNRVVAAIQSAENTVELGLNNVWDEIHHASNRGEPDEDTKKFDKLKNRIETLKSYPGITVEVTLSGKEYYAYKGITTGAGSAGMNKAIEQWSEDQGGVSE